MNETDDNLMCPICSKYRPEIEHPQPFIDATGEWICGTCWFLHHEISRMKPKQHHEEPRP